MRGQRSPNPTYNFTHGLSEALAPVLTDVLRVAKPCARLDVKCLAEALIDYYLGLSFRASSAGRG